MPLDVFEYLLHLDQARYRVIILHAAPDKGSAVTHFTKKVCAKSGGKYLNLLELFIQHKALNEHIDSFGPEKFRELLIEHSKGCGFLCVDQMDFLVDTWRRAERQAFFRLVTDQWDSYREDMAAKLLICLQTSHEIEALQISDSQGQTRVWQLSDFNDIA